MTTPIGNNQPLQVGSFQDIPEPSANSESGSLKDQLQSIVGSKLNARIRDAAAELLDQIRDDNYWDAKLDSLEDRGELIEDKKLLEHLEFLTRIANQASVLESLHSNAV